MGAIYYFKREQSLKYKKINKCNRKCSGDGCLQSNTPRSVAASVGRWFADNIVREVEDGTQTLFWWDPWIDGLVLKSSFSRLFDLVVNKMATVAEMFSLGWEEDGEVWQWRHMLFA